MFSANGNEIPEEMRGGGGCQMETSWGGTQDRGSATVQLLKPAEGCLDREREGEGERVRDKQG